MGEPLGRRDKSAGTRKHTDKNEKRLAKKLAGRRQLASGSTLSAKGDIELTDFLLDSKETINGSIKVDGADLVKITRQAREVTRSPGLVLTINGITAKATSREWVLITLDDFKQLLQRLKEVKNE